MKTTQIMKGSLVFLLLVLVIKLVAQKVNPPEDIVDLVVNFNTFVGSLAGYAAVTIFLTGLINGWSRITKSWVKQIVSWVVPVILVAIVSFVLKAGFLAGENVGKVLVYGLGTGLVSNGVFDIAFVNQMVNWIVSKLGGVVKKE